MNNLAKKRRLKMFNWKRGVLGKSFSFIALIFFYSIKLIVI